ncbi:restriction endonuclease subunit S [Sphaerotilus microaerophilus]|uniref:Type I restriction enzyme specificity protein n=1 Tax=Sphaerotilus microaerophilus TaxID=2914710 RepID=A0ABM7YLI5_9BURK|nr:restriction endonuclease subunit S [Sphaerotilus sp. FB-5]BDI05306.1 type I restriction enzyme specificity protein [Sphaerotilus sp. FB-5]
MSFPRYQDYKPSGVEWLGEVPAHWNVTRIKHVVRSLEQGWSPQCEGFPVESDHEWGVLKVGCVNGGVFNAAENKALPAEMEPIPELGIRLGDLLISRANTRELVGSAAVARRDYANLLLCDKLYRLRVEEAACVPEFLGYYLGTGISRGAIEVAATGASSSMVNIGQSTILEMSAPVPTVPDQRQIVEFLDRETNKIDALVAEQEKLIALLAEKRQATISHAVTRGLNPNAPMKVSGVDWLGEVPAHWSLPPLYLRYEAALGKMLDTSRITGQHLVPYLRNVDVQWDAINVADLPQMDIESSELTRYTVREGDLLVCEGGEVGRAAVVVDAGGTLGYQKALHRLRALTADEVPRFMYYTLRFASKVGAFSGEGQSTIAHLTGEQLRKYRFPKPPIEEQCQIVTFLDTETTKLDALDIEAERAIRLLKARRAALIAAAVTGQIDVRTHSQEPATETA